MSDLTTYQIVPDDSDPEALIVIDLGETVRGVLVPDSRLRAIADAWKAIKQTNSLGYSSRQEHKVLDSLLDALTEEDKDGWLRNQGQR